MKTPRIRVTLSDPWDLGESINWKPLFGTLVRMEINERGGRALVRFDQSLSYQGVEYQFAVAAPRHLGVNLRSLQDGEKIFCSFTGVSEQHANSSDALSTDFWRGGLAFVGDLVLENS